MSINPSYERTQPFCDKFTVTVPYDSEGLVVSNLEQFSQVFFMERQHDSCYRSSSYGSVTWGRRGGVTWLTTSGKFLADLRAATLLDAYLCCFTSHPDNPLIPHRVSHIDATVDEYRYAPPVVQRALSLGYGGKVSFTRKPVKPTDVREFLSQVQYNGTGDKTGTAYLGGQKARVRGKIYDKTQEVYIKSGQLIRDTARHELSAKGDIGLSLRDVSQPSSLFWAYWPSSFLVTPPNVLPWVPGGEGYTVPRGSVLPGMKLKTRVECSLEVDALIRLALLSGASGIIQLTTLIERRCSKGLASGVYVASDPVWSSGGGWAS